MTQGTLFDLPVGKARRKAGETRVLSKDEIWREGFYNTIQLWFVSLPVGTKFIGEDLRRYAIHVGMTRPHHHNTWSACAARMLRQWFKANLIERDGYRTAEAKRAHARMYPQYRKVAS